MKLHPAANDDGQIVGFAFQCVGCEHAHIFYVAGPVTWTCDGDQRSPTFTPSLLNTCDDHPDLKQRRCHLNLTKGQICYHGDCSHDLRGKAVDLPDWPY